MKTVNSLREAWEASTKVAARRLDRRQPPERAVVLKSPVMGRRLEEIRLPENCIVVSVQRGRKVIIPHGDTVLTAGDRMVGFATEECASALRDVFRPVVPTDENAGPPTVN